MKTLYLVAMEEEIQGIFSLEKHTLKKEHGFVFFVDAKEESILVKTGIGKSNAAAATQFALQYFLPDQIINTGLVGSFNTTIPLGEVIQISECRFFDVDVTTFDYKPGQLPGSNFVSYPLMQNNSNLKKYLLVTGDTFLSEIELKKKVTKIFKPDVVDMELASIAHVCSLHGKLDILSSIKAVSDYTNESSTSDFKTVMKNGLSNIKQFLDK